MAKNNNLTDFLTDVADAIRTKKGTSALIDPQNFSDEIASIETGGIEGYNVESVDNGDGTQTLVITGEDEIVTGINLQTYKFQDLANVENNGGIIATDQEYEDAEVYLQTLYGLILNGGANE